MTIEYRTRGTCSRRIVVDVEDGIIRSVGFEGGCHGNLQGIAALAQGQKPEEVIEKLEGIRCGFKNTSCPDQLAQALKQAL